MRKRFLMFFVILSISCLVFYLLEKSYSKTEKDINKTTSNNTNIQNNLEEKINTIRILKEASPAIVKKDQDTEKIENYLLGKFNPKDQDNIVLVSNKYTLSSNKIYLRTEAYQAFMDMQKKASLNGINLKIVSGLRNFTYQKNIWEQKWNGKTLVGGKNLQKNIPNELERAQEILKYSSMPGTSRHHWGADMDLNSTEPSYFNSIKGKAEYTWLVKNASDFGFCQPYNEKNTINKRTGYNEEKWHWSYVPISKKLTNDYVSLIKNIDIKEFLGDKYTQELNIIKDYVLGVNSNCL